MGCMKSKPDEAQQLVISNDQAISKKLAKDRLKDQRTLKLLLLGPGDSGKTTFFKQLRVLYGSGYSLDERKERAPVLIENLLEGTLSVIAACKSKHMSRVESPEGSAALDVLNALNPKELRVMSEETADALRILWSNDNFIDTWNKRYDFQVLDSCFELATNLMSDREWGTLDWTPSLREMFLSRVRTTGIIEEDLMVNKVAFKVVDVGGQRNERRKWIHSFQDVSAVIFMCAISEYDQKLFEDGETNRLVEALTLFEAVLNMEWFKRTTVIVFLNKSDLFEQKYHMDKVPLNSSGCFPDAPEDSTFSTKIALTWIGNKFKDISQKVNSNRPLYIHTTCALDSSGMSRVFEASRKTILHNNLVTTGFMEDGNRYDLS